MPLLELITKTGIADAIASLPGGVKSSEEAVAETIQNNVRSKIVKEELSDPAYFARMSALLAEIIEARKARAIDYQEYLRRIAELVKKVERPEHVGMPLAIDTPGKRALYSNLGQNAERALAVDKAVRETRQDDWRGNQARERLIQRSLLSALNADVDAVKRIFPIIVAQAEY